MQMGLAFHNAMQLSIPIWVVLGVYHNFPGANLVPIAFVSILGTLFPDVDHFSMWKRVKHNGLWSFVKFCIHADRYRKAFLPFHNYLAMLVVAVAAGVFSFVNFYVFIFFLSFLAHLVSDFVADLYMIKKHTHWRLRNWFDESSIRLSVAQQIQPGNKQEHNA
jgi:hypothetical protein